MSPKFRPRSISKCGENRPRLHVTSFGMSDVGQRREANEDRFVVAEFARSVTVHQSNIPQPRSSFSEGRGYLFLVADGLGGSQAGEVASALSVVTIEDFLLNCFRRLTSIQPEDHQTVLNDLHAALYEADAKIFREAAQHPEWKGMGTTLTMALAIERHLLLAHAGDSRCYLFSGGFLQQITQDHTFTAEMERNGLIEAQSLSTHPWRHVVSNLLGGSEPGVKVDVYSLELDANDVLLLCSDGLTEMINDEKIMEILQSEADPKLACAKLVAEANREGGRDNITVIVARFAEAAG